MATASGWEKYDGKPKTMVEVLKEFVWCDWDLLEDMAEKATDADTLLNLTEAALVCNGSLDDGMSDDGTEILYVLKRNKHLPEEACKLIEAQSSDDDDYIDCSGEEDACEDLCKRCDQEDCEFRKAEYDISYPAVNH